MASPRAMILAAGLGTRLRPVTESIPKPLVPVFDRPMIENVILALAGAGINRLAVNTHHLAEQIEDYVAAREGGQDVEIFNEPRILGTGGGLVGARGLLEEEEYFLLHNGDVVSDLDLSLLRDEHEKHLPLATLVLADGHENRVMLAEDGKVLDILGSIGAVQTPGARMLTYTGIAAISRRIFDYLPPEGPSSLPAALIAALEDDPDCIRGMAPADLYWDDVGTMERYLAVNRDAIEGRLQLPEYTGPGGLELLVEQGSDRRFYRLSGRDASWVLMFSPRGDPDNARFMEIGEYLRRLKLGVPGIVVRSGDDSSAMLEDLGDGRLYDLAGAENAPGVLEGLYCRVVDFLVRMITTATEEIDDCPAAGTRSLHFGQLRWESSYFCEHFLQNVLGFEEGETAGLEQELEALACAVEMQPYVFMHRDFQSQNILIKDREIRIVDFQGARRGPIGYDLASLLRDPYVELPAELRRKLVEFFRLRLKELSGSEATPDQMNSCYVLAGLQRSMQALGAYGYLTLVRKKETFRQFYVPGLARLKDGLEEFGRIDGVDFGLCRLAACVEKAEARLSKRQDSFA